MKKIILTLSIISTLLSSCKKDDPVQPSSSRPNTTCNCGTITDDPISNGQYQLSVRNDCSGNVRTFNVNFDNWLNGHVGERTCFTNVSSW